MAAPPHFSERPGAAALPEAGEGFQGFEAEPPLNAAREAATAKIAAEADATAQALGNLQRLLNEHVLPAAPAPHPQRINPPDQPPLHRHARLDLPDGTAPFPHGGEMAPLLPLPVSQAEEGASGRSVYLLGFVTGLVLSVMAGAALYFLIAVG
jgi:hypothetical protein